MSYDATITRLPVRTLFELRGPRDALADWCADVLPSFPGQLNCQVEAAGGNLLMTGPGRWLLMAPIEEEHFLSAALRPDEAPVDISIVLISDTLTFFSVIGLEAEEVMSVATPLDLHQDAFLEDGASWTEAMGIRALIRRIDGGYELAVDRSYADWFEACLTSAAS